MSNPIVSSDEQAVKDELRELVRKTIEETIIEMYLAGVSTRRIEDVSEILWGAGVSASTVSNLNDRARQRGVEQLGTPRRGPRHVAPRGKGNAQPARIPDRHGGHLFDLGERAHHRRGAWRLQAHRGHHRPHRRVGGYHRCYEAYLQLQSVVKEGDGGCFPPDAKPTQNRRKIVRRFCIFHVDRGNHHRFL